MMVPAMLSFLFYPTRTKGNIKKSLALDQVVWFEWLYILRFLLSFCEGGGWNWWTSNLVRSFACVTYNCLSPFRLYFGKTDNYWHWSLNFYNSQHITSSRANPKQTNMYIHCNMFQLHISDTFFNFQTFLGARDSLPPPPPLTPSYLMSLHLLRAWRNMCIQI